mgnify:CR=1 FL=1|jgi:hypothetical protein
MNIDEFIEHTKEKAREHRYHADFFESDNPMNTACIKSAEDCEQLAEWLEKSKEYQQLEEQGRLVKLPCKVGDDVYYILGIPNETPCAIDKCTFELSDINKIGKTLFLTESEAEAKLKELRGGEDGTME